ncbi:hypothetical protein J6590_064997 [Homalodisca vitripennis]|nr:hypothetical protein J6590_064997 [Homalodisca vitripennis]
MRPDPCLFSWFPHGKDYIVNYISNEEEDIVWVSETYEEEDIVCESLGERDEEDIVWLSETYEEEDIVCVSKTYEKEDIVCMGETYEEEDIVWVNETFEKEDIVCMGETYEEEDIVWVSETYEKGILFAWVRLMRRRILFVCDSRKEDNTIRVSETDHEKGI